MGQNQSILQSNSMQVENNISQISNEKCVNLCVQGGDTTVVVRNSTVGNITNETLCAINGASCTLKSTLTDSVTNILTNTQNAKLKDEEDPSNFLNTLAEMGESQDISQSNAQRVVNNITQQMNSVCMNKSMNSGNTQIHVINAKAGNINNVSKGNVSNTNCIIANMATNTTSNSLTNSQTASIVKEGMFGSFGFLLIIAAVVLLHKHKKQHAENMARLAKGEPKKK